MKQVTIFVFTCLLLLTQLNAQSNKKTNFGIKGGFNHTVIDGVQTNGEETGFIGSSIYGALFLETHIGPTTFLGTELLFSWTNDWHFIEVPIHIKQMLTSRFGLFIGPKFDFSANKFDKTKGDKSDFFGVSMEAGAQFNLLKRIFVEGRYSVGLSEQFQDISFDINDGKRNNLRVGVGFRF